MNNFTKASLLGISSLVLSSNSYAALVTQNFTGQFLNVDAAYISGEPTLAGISLASDVFGSITYEDTLVADVGNTFIGPVELTLNFGPLSYTHLDDLDWGLGPFPDADFFDGELVGIGFLTDQVDAMLGPIWELDVFGNQFGFYDVDTGAMLADGILDFTPTSAVPLPTAAWLFLSGLIGLFGVARRKPIKK